jgi:glutamate racemase
MGATFTKIRLTLMDSLIKISQVMKNVKSNRPVIGLFDSGIGGYSVLAELIKVFPEADFYYYSDDAHAPYGPKSDEYLTDRSFKITDELISKGVELIVIACNTATASSIDALRQHFTSMVFVGVEPYLNAYYKVTSKTKMAVLTTESTGKSERFKRLKERLDPQGNIDHYSLKNLARLVEQYYYDPSFEKEFKAQLGLELLPLKDKGYTHAILGCTHYPLVSDLIEKSLQLKTLSPCPYVAGRVKELAGKPETENEYDEFFNFYSSTKPEWTKKNRKTFFGPFKK